MFKRYFRPGQKVQLCLASPARGDDRLETLTGYCQEIHEGLCLIALPYPCAADEPLLWKPGTPVELFSDNRGLGLRAAATLERQVEPGLLRFRLNGDLNLFQRRPRQRLNATIGIRFSRAVAPLSAARLQWSRQLAAIVESPAGPPPTLPRGLVNLSTGGIRLGFKNPLQVADLCLMLLQFEPATPPICTLAETVWVEKHETGTYTAGLQFAKILARDQERIERFIRERQRSAPR